MGATFSRIKTWVAGETLTDSQLNSEFNNILNNLDPSGIDDESANDAAAQATSDPYPGSSLSKATSLETELQQLRYLIAQITGETYWYIDPDTDFATLNTWKTSITATASEINTPLDGASVTLTEFRELETIGDTTISANQWAALGGIAETLTSAELNILDGVTATTAELNILDGVTATTSEINRSSDGITEFDRGRLSRAQFTYKDADEIYIGAGVYECNGKILYWNSQLTSDIGFPVLNDWYYLYIDDSDLSGNQIITASELIWSNTEPAWSHALHGWYNGNDRCIFAVKTDASSNIEEFYQSGDFAVFADQRIAANGQDVDTTWVDIASALDIPKFATMAQVTAYTETIGSAGAIFYWRTNGQTGTTGHYLLRWASATDDLGFGSANVITDSGQLIELKCSVASTDAISVYVNGWYFPVGM